MVKSVYKSIVIFGDSYGIPQLLKYIPKQFIKGIVVAHIRPQYIDFLEKIASDNFIQFFIQPKFGTNEYSNFYEKIKEMQFDLLVCNSYSMIIRSDILQLVNYNAINIHAALLPLNRGCNPTQWAIIKNEKITGVTMHHINDELDEGDIIAQKSVCIGFKDTWVSIEDKFPTMIDNLLEEQMNNILTNNIKRIKQDNNKATYNKRLNKDSPKIDFNSMTNLQIYNLIRAQVYPLKGAYIEKNNERINFQEYIEFSEIQKIRRKYAE